MSRRPSGKKAENAEFVVNEVERNRQFSLAGSFITRIADKVRDETHASVAAIVVSENEARRYQYDAPSMPGVLARAGYEPRNPMANFRATNDPNFQELTDEELELLWQQTNAARAAITAEQNQPRRGNN